MPLKYGTIKRDIIEEVESGEPSAGEKVHSEGDLKREYNVNNITIVKVLNDLVSEGYLTRHQGERTLVRKNLEHRKVFFSKKLSMPNNKK